MDNIGAIMSNMTFQKLHQLFEISDFKSISNESSGVRFLKLRSISRKSLLKEFCTQNKIEIENENMFKEIFEKNSISENQIDDFIKSKYLEERKLRKKDENFLVDQLNRLPSFDWGGSFGNSLEKNIVNNYVKKIKSYNKINEEIEGSLLSSLRGYTLNSWYNHWTSILIEDIFKDHENVLPTVGLIKKIDFFIQNIPFDLKVTYFPEQLLKEKLKLLNFGVELTKTKQICRELKIFIPKDLKDDALKVHLQNKLSEDKSKKAKLFLAKLSQLKNQIIEEIIKNPKELKIWLYENQGEMRFDASNRFFLILINQNNLNESWKLKRNIKLLKEGINNHLDNISKSKINDLNIKFKWEKTSTEYNCKSDILFIKI
jgi:hypothetical protein